MRWLHGVIGAACDSPSRDGIVSGVGAHLNAQSGVSFHRERKSSSQLSPSPYVLRRVFHSTRQAARDTPNNCKHRHVGRLNGPRSHSAPPLFATLLRQNENAFLFAAPARWPPAGMCCSAAPSTSMAPCFCPDTGQSIFFHVYSRDDGFGVATCNFFPCNDRWLALLALIGRLHFGGLPWTPFRFVAVVLIGDMRRPQKIRSRWAKFDRLAKIFFLYSNGIIDWSRIFAE